MKRFIKYGIQCGFSMLVVLFGCNFPETQSDLQRNESPAKALAPTKITVNYLCDGPLAEASSSILPAGIEELYSACINGSGCFDLQLNIIRADLGENETLPKPLTRATENKLKHNIKISCEDLEADWNYYKSRPSIPPILTRPQNPKLNNNSLSPSIANKTLEVRFSGDSQWRQEIRALVDELKREEVPDGFTVLVTDVRNASNQSQASVTDTSPVSKPRTVSNTIDSDEEIESAAPRFTVPEPLNLTLLPDHQRNVRKLNWVRVPGVSRINVSIQSEYVTNQSGKPKIAIDIPETNTGVDLHGVFTQNGIILTGEAAACVAEIRVNMFAKRPDNSQEYIKASGKLTSKLNCQGH